MAEKDMKDFWAGLVNFLNSLKDSATVDQYMGLLRQAIPAIGGLCVALGWISQEHMSAYVTSILSAAGPILLFIGVVWSMIANSQFSIRKAAAKLPENKPR
jgi:putative Mn2+ efflux pump MntP